MDKHTRRTQATYQGTEAIRSRVGSSRQGLGQQAGATLEEIAARKFNEAAARSKQPTMARVTHTQNPHDPADIRVRFEGHAEVAVQAKNWTDIGATASILTEPKYDRMQLIVPTDKFEAVRDVLDRRASAARTRGDDRAAERLEDTAQRLTPRIDAGDVQAGGASSREARFAAQHDRLYGSLIDGEAIGREAAARGAETAAIAAMDATLQGVFKAMFDVAAGGRSLPDAAQDLRVDVSAAVGQGAKQGALTGLLRAGADRGGLRVLSDAHVAAAAAHLLLDGYADVRRYRDGDIDLEDLISALGYNSMASMWSLYGAGAMAMALGPGLPAAFAGYATHQIATQAIAGINELRQEADLAEDEAARIRVLVEASTALLSSCERQLDQAATALHADNAAKLETAFEEIDVGLACQSNELVIDGLVAIASLCGSSLHLADFGEFDSWMTSDGPELTI